MLICLAAVCLIFDLFGSFVCCISAVVLHESGHLAAMSIFGYKPESINISLFEIKISDSKRLQKSFTENILIIFSGPFANFICFILFYLLYLSVNEYFFSFAAANLSVGLFNLLPVISLDGGQLLYIILSRFVSDSAAEKTVGVITFVSIFPFAALGFLLLLESKYNFSLLFVCVYLVFSLVCKSNRYY